eukprot:GFYU01007131.1.p1 GENE.GFYU01007131.1~~GFYU01007131.1.p1  ORF type:complete len:579 (-),score=135.05 GFYU01007131.1:57-1742(-)
MGRFKGWFQSLVAEMEKPLVVEGDSSSMPPTSGSRNVPPEIAAIRTDLANRSSVNLDKRTTGPVSRTAIAVYAIPNFVLAAFNIWVGVYLVKFYADVVGVRLDVLGWMTLACVVFYAVAQPTIGYLSDRTRTRIGRRRPYLLGASIPFALSLWLLFSPPKDFPIPELWLCVFGFIIFISSAVIEVAYESFAPEITFDYDERTLLTGSREAMYVFGAVCASAYPAILHQAFGADKEGERSTFAIMGGTYGPLAFILIFNLVLRQKELPHPPVTSVAITPWKVLMRMVSLLKTKPSTILLSAYGFSTFGLTINGSLFPFFAQYIVKSKKTYLFPFVFFTSAVAFLPVWVHMARTKLEKRVVFLICLVILITGSALMYFLVGEGDEELYFCLCGLTGIGYGGYLALPSSIKTDITDYDEMYSGQRREGRYTGLWLMSQRLTAAMGVGAGLKVLKSAGYEEGSEVQSQYVLDTLRVLYVGVPAICCTISMIIAWLYPITREHHKDIQQAIVDRAGGMDVIDPIYGTRLEGYKAGALDLPSPSTRLGLYAEDASAMGGVRHMSLSL